VFQGRRDRGNQGIAGKAQAHQATGDAIETRDWPARRFLG
jgi:hypothetical protein